MRFSAGHFHAPVARLVGRDIVAGQAVVVARCLEAWMDQE